MKANLKYKKVKAVYLIRINGLSEIKIGYSLDLFTKFKELDYPDGFEVLGVVYCDSPRDIFELLISEYDHKRYRANWFELSDEDIHYILEAHDSLGFMFNGKRIENSIAPTKYSLCQTEDIMSLDNLMLSCEEVRVYANLVGLRGPQNNIRFYTI